MEEEKKSKRINLFCPSSSNSATLLVRSDQRLDLGSIARTFNIVPSTLKINSHFISRGTDLIASSVTWNSLLSFFSSRRLSTGASPSSALLVTGTISTKRTHDPSEFGESKTMKMHHNSSVYGCGNREGLTLSNRSGVGMKRKLLLEAISPSKRSKSRELSK